MRPFLGLISKYDFGVSCLLSQETLAICDINMLNFRPYFSLNVYVNYIILGVVRSLAYENFAFVELKMLNFCTSACPKKCCIW